jgi:hypothetical protein
MNAVNYLEHGALLIRLNILRPTVPIQKCILHIYYTDQQVNNFQGNNLRFLGDSYKAYK